MTGDAAQQQQEPSMEEILASIRKIISEDGPNEAESPDVVELTNPVPAAPDNAEQLSHVEPPQPSVPEPEPEPQKPDFSAVGTDTMPDAIETAVMEIQEVPPPPDPQPPSDSDHAEAVLDQDALLNDDTVAKAASAFGRLQQSENGLSADSMQSAVMPPLPNIGQMTVEDLVRNTLKPLLKEWLDVNLAPMVEDHIRREMERIRSNTQEDRL